MDGTFKYCPKHFYQIFNIIGNKIETNNKIPLMYILMSNKSYQLYYCIFEYIQKLLILENIDVNFKKIIFTTDFERRLRKALIDSFPDNEILG